MEKSKDPKKKPRCIVCGEQKEGLGVKTDNVIKTLRWLNQHTVKAKNPYIPVVCRECFPKYYKKRKSFERKQVIYVIIGIFFLIFLAIAARGSIGAILVGLLITGFMYLLSFLTYMPQLDIPQNSNLAQNKENKKKTSLK
jgi:hypothetical protein